MTQTDDLARDLRLRWGTEVARADDGRLRYLPRPGAIVEMLHGVERYGDRVFLVHGDRRVTFEEFRAAIAGAADLLREHGVGPGGRVMILSYNRAEFVLAVWAIWWAGAVAVLGNRWWSAEESRHALEVTGPVLLLCDEGGPELDHPVATLPIAELGPLLDTPPSGGAPATLPASEHDEALVLFTSGSSGPPKGVSLSQASVIANQHNLLRRSRQLPQSIDPSAPPTVMLTCTPLFHIGGVSNLITQLLVGGRLVMTEGRFDAGQVLELIEREGVHRWGGVPTMAARLLAHPDLEARDLSTLRSFPLGGAPVPAELLERMQRALPQLRERGLANTWGMTETGGFVTVAGNKDLQVRPGTVGAPYEVAELRIADADENGVGEILVRSPTVMERYLGLDDPGVDADGWLRTGDLGHLDPDGYLHLDGRLKDIVIRGGENIACAHVEKALLSHPDVVEAAVLGLPHEDLGEELAAVVTRRAGTDLGEADLRDHLAGRLAKFEIPARWSVRGDALPTLAGEKVDKGALRDELVAASG